MLIGSARVLVWSHACMLHLQLSHDEASCPRMQGVSVLSMFFRANLLACAAASSSDRVHVERQAVVVASPEPRAGVSSGTHLRTHAAWVHALEADTVHGRNNAPSFHHLCSGNLAMFGTVPAWRTPPVWPPTWLWTRSWTNLPTLLWQGVAC
jgi:hypothetical protein